MQKISMKTKRKWWLLPFIVGSFGVFLYLLLNTAPQSPLPLYTNLTVSTTSLFFLSAFSFCFFLFWAIFNRVIQGLLFGIFLLAFLLLRFFHLTHPLFPLLLFGIFFMLEMVFFSRKKS